MTIKQFKESVYDPAMKRNDGNKIDAISDKDRMILAMGESVVAIDNNSFTQYQQLMATLTEIDDKGKVPERKELIEQAAKTWRVELDKLKNNLKKLFTS